MQAGHRESGVRVSKIAGNEYGIGAGNSSEGK